MATGASMRAAVLALQRSQPATIIAAVPVASQEACVLLAQTADRNICLQTPEPFGAVGQWYADFTQTSDEEVLACMQRARKG